MTSSSHALHPEIWFRPSPHITFAALYTQITSESLTASLRMGRRDGLHPKGYSPGQRVTLRLLDAEGHEVSIRYVEIVSVVTYLLRELSAIEFGQLGFYTNIEDILKDLSFFEKRVVAPNEEVSIVTYNYLT